MLYAGIAQIFALILPYLFSLDIFLGGIVDLVIACKDILPKYSLFTMLWPTEQYFHSHTEKQFTGSGSDQDENYLSEKDALFLIIFIDTFPFVLPFVSSSWIRTRSPAPSVPPTMSTSSRLTTERMTSSREPTAGWRRWWRRYTRKRRWWETETGSKKSIITLTTWEKRSGFWNCQASSDSVHQNSIKWTFESLPCVQQVWYNWEVKLRWSLCIVSLVLNLSQLTATFRAV